MAHYKSRKSLLLKISPRWKAGKSHRQALQKQIEKSRTRNPHLKYSSISHTHNVGGFALASKPIGLDLEPRMRPVSLAVLKRIGTPQEIRQISKPLHLWVMKEAAYKAARGPKQPSTISKIKIIRVRYTKDRQKANFSFKINGLRSRGQGVITIRARYILGIATLSAQL